MVPYRLIEFAEIDSTNQYACVNLRRLAHGDVIQAQVQTAGRGRWQRAWVSHVPGNLYLSFVLKPQGAPASQLPWAEVSLLLAVCVCRVLDSYHVPAALKWPNDILVNGRKIAGILAETVVHGSEFLGLVLGIGVNLNLDAAALATINQPATSLSVELGHRVEVPPFRDALVSEFLRHYEAFIQQGFRLIREEYLRRSPFIGQEVEIRRAESVVRGRVRTVNAEGRLELVTPSGDIQVVGLGEMFLRS